MIAMIDSLATLMIVVEVLVHGIQSLTQYYVIVI